MSSVDWSGEIHYDLINSEILTGSVSKGHSCSFGMQNCRRTVRKSAVEVQMFGKVFNRVTSKLGLSAVFSSSNFGSGRVTRSTTVLTRELIADRPASPGHRVLPD